MVEANTISPKQAIEVLLEEIDKLKDLNTLALRYKDVAGTLSIALDSFLSSESRFREEYAFDRREIVNDLVSFKSSLNDAIESMSFIDGTLKQSVTVINSSISALEDLSKRQEESVRDGMLVLSEDNKAIVRIISELKDLNCACFESQKQLRTFIGSSIIEAADKMAIHNNDIVSHHISQFENRVSTEFSHIRDKCDAENHSIQRFLKWILILSIGLVFLGIISLFSSFIS